MLYRFLLFIASGMIFALGCAQGPTTDIDRLVARAIATQPVSADEAIVTLMQTVRSIDIALQTIDQNIANAQSVGYKSRRVIFRTGEPAAVLTDYEQGSLESTGRPLDVAIQGSGFLEVELLGRSGRASGYTRCGNLFRSRDGDLILGVGDGFQLVPKINIPVNVPLESISIQSNGKVEYFVPGSNIKTLAGQIRLVQFANLQGLETAYGSVLRKTDRSGEPLFDIPGDNGAGVLLSGFLEASNVSLAGEELRRIAAERWRAAIERAIARRSH